MPSSSASAWQATQLVFRVLRPAATSPGRSPDEEDELDVELELLLELEVEEELELEDEVDEALELDEEEEEPSPSLPAPQPTNRPSTINGTSFFTLFPLTRLFLGTLL